MKLLIILILTLIIIILFTSSKTNFGSTSDSINTYQFLALPKDQQMNYLNNAINVPITKLFMCREVPLWIYFTPGKDISKLPILFVFHGNNRNAVDYIKMWKEFADASPNGYIIVCAEFSNEYFPKATGYATGNIMQDGNNRDPETNAINPISAWTFSLIEPIFDDICLMTNNSSNTYSAWGHSAGAQFLHRFAMLIDNRLDKIVCANAGFYTQPFKLNGETFCPNYNGESSEDSDKICAQFIDKLDILKYPYGLTLKYEETDREDHTIDKVVIFNNIDNLLDTFASKNMTIILGQNDNGTVDDKNCNATSSVSGIDCTHGAPQPAPRNSTTAAIGHNYEHRTWWNVGTIWENNINPPGPTTSYKTLLPDPEIGKTIFGQNSEQNRYSRNARGQVYFYSNYLRAKSKPNTPFNWNLVQVPNVGHDPQNMARASYNIFDPAVNVKCVTGNPVPCPQPTSDSIPPDAPPGGGDEGGNPEEH